jgi:hypothetical protein
MSRSNFDLGLIPKPTSVTKVVENGFTIAVSHSINSPGLCQPVSTNKIITPVVELNLNPMQKWNWWNDPRSSKIQVTLDNTIIVNLDRDKFVNNFMVIE